MAKHSHPKDLALLESLWKHAPSRHVLDNGLTLLIQKDSSAPVASVQVWVKTGSIHEDQHLGAGISHYLEHMLFKGTQRRQARDISAEVQAHGGNINAYTTFDRTVYYIDLPSEHVDMAVDVLSDMVQHSTLPPEEVERERDVILREIDMGKDDPDQQLSEALFETAFRSHPFRYPIIGYREVFEKITREELLDYYHRRYVPNNMIVVVAGDVEEARILDSVKKHFDAKRKGLASVLLSQERTQLTRRERHLHEDVELTQVGMAWQIPALGHRDSPVLDMLAMIIGQGDSSILWQELRERLRLVHNVDAYSWPQADMGLFYVYFSCDPGNREKAVAAVENILSRLGAEEIEKYLDKVLRQMVVAEVNSRRTMTGQASRLGIAELLVGDLNFSQSYFKRIALVKAEDFPSVIAKYLQYDRASIVSLNPKSGQRAGDAEEHREGGSSEVKLIELENGARILLQKNEKLPSLHLRVICEGGVMHEEGRWGATNLLATMLIRDTRKRSAAEVAETIESLGGQFFPFSGVNSFGLGMELLKSDVDKGLDILGDALLCPVFKEDSLAVERASQIADLQHSNDDIVARGRRLLRKKFFGDYPLAHGSSGEIDTVEKVTAEDLRRLWEKLLVSGNVILSVCGDLDEASLLPGLKAILEKLPDGERPRRSRIFKTVQEAGSFREPMAREQVVVFSAFPGASMNDEDFFVGEVADELFSGMSSRLFERVREEKGLAYFVRSGRLMGFDAGMFMFYAGTAPGKEGEVLAEIWAEIERVKSGALTEEELQRCRVRLKAARKMALQGNSAKAMHAGLALLYGRPLNDESFYDGKIDAVGAGELAQFAAKRFNRDSNVEFLIGAV